ncbi:nitroreductase [Bradyrhizobium nanningense]|uniref:Nitroreductase n=1 Tax=Bradyrhizobium nanningense TaxID=1325118 RepID=A0A4Q0RZ36_9BRAD|nr:nitroreductase [Bradyrhizobium nanningense]RXH24135.1 nitroreductase [Bradyrhizobium nanningense]RXH29308.1 nitroreductase [Bradyrhizobium nanningense]
MSALEEVLIGECKADAVVQTRIDEIIAGRFACREFCDAPVPRRTIEQILRVARFAPSGANIQPWHVYVLAGAAKYRVSAALLEAHETSSDEHVSEYKYYASDLPDRYLRRRQEFGRLFYGSLGIAQADVEARSYQTAKNYTFFGAPVGLIVTIDRRLEIGSWLDLGMFVQNVMLAAAGRGLQSCPQETFSKYHQILRSLLSIPEEQMVVCGISIGRAKVSTMDRLMPRAEVDEFATFVGFEA